MRGSRNACNMTPEHVEGASGVPVIDGEGTVCGAHAQNPAIAAEGHALHDANLGELLLRFACSASPAVSSSFPLTASPLHASRLCNGDPGLEGHVLALSDTLAN